MVTFLQLISMRKCHFVVFELTTAEACQKRAGNTTSANLKKCNPSQTSLGLCSRKGVFVWFFLFQLLFIQQDDFSELERILSSSHKFLICTQVNQYRKSISFSLILQAQQKLLPPYFLFMIMGLHLRIFPFELRGQVSCPHPEHGFPEIFQSIP